VIEPVREGDCYRFEYNMETRAGNVYPAGSLLHVVQATRDCPYGEISESGTNWLCSTEFGADVWATLEQCIARGLLVKVSGCAFCHGTGVALDGLTCEDCTGRLD
jgi:hypothetical protein